jgi:DNA invertase Pin-like site-specific DNA recombinase
MARYGYARVSTIDQDLRLQEAALRAAGCDIVRAEKVSGTMRDGRAELALLLAFLRPGDTLVVTRIDRLARSIKDLQDIVETLKHRGATLMAIEQPIDTTHAAGKAFLDMLGVFAEFETNLRRERQLEGIAAAKRRGVYQGSARDTCNFLLLLQLTVFATNISSENGAGSVVLCSRNTY